VSIQMDVKQSRDMYFYVDYILVDLQPSFRQMSITCNMIKIIGK